jgi:hypothetical protein
MGTSQSTPNDDNHHPNDDIMKDAYDAYKETGDMYEYAQVHQACDNGGYAGSAGCDTGGGDVVSATVDTVVETVSYVASDSK